MSAELLRKAAALMRERAQAATESPWGQPRLDWSADLGGQVYCLWDSTEEQRFVTASYGEDDAAHIASWHPAVALAVADWLADEAHNYAINLDIWQRASQSGDSVDAWRNKTPESNAEYHFRAALDVARAYLGRDA